MTIVWFNGPSQDPLISVLPKQQYEIGCNHIQRYRAVDAVCVFDFQIMDDIELQPDKTYYTRPDAARPGYQVLTDTVLNSTNSGILALHVALKRPDDIFIIGCDWGLTDHSCQDVWYGKGYTTRKYTNSMKRKIAEMCKQRTVAVVTDLKPDIDLPKISIDRFIDQYQNK